MQKAVTLPVNHPLRKPLLDALRPLVEKDLRQKVLFRVDFIRVLGDFAFLKTEPRTPADKPLDFTKTHYKSLIDQGVFDGPVCYALVKKVEGRWVGQVHVIGPSDVTWANWTEVPYRAPRALLLPEQH